MTRRQRPKEQQGQSGIDRAEFDADGEAYDFAGTKTEQIKQIGNAVSVRKMKACVGAIMADAVPRRTSRIDKAERAA